MGVASSTLEAVADSPLGGRTRKEAMMAKMPALWRPSWAARRWVVLLLLLAELLPGLPTPPPAAAGPMIGSTPIFPADNIWNRNVVDLPAHPQSAAMLANIGAASLKADFGAGLWNGGPIGIPYTVVDAGQPLVPIVYTAYGDESDPGPMPIPATAPVEGGNQSTGDRHVIVVDQANGLLYELYRAFKNNDNSWRADSGARWSLTANTLRPDTWTSADAAGLPIFPGLARYDEVAAGQIDHALRFTLPRTRRQHLWPARHDASSSTDPTRPPMGARLRLKANVDVSGYPAQSRVILQALKRYGMILADNGSPLFVSGAPDERWNNDDLRSLAGIKTTDFEFVDSLSAMLDPESAQARSTIAPFFGGPTGATRWYFAEGYTGPGFDQYLTIQNPNPTPAQVEITYFLTGQPFRQRTISVPANSRATQAVHSDAEGVGRNQAVATRLLSLNGVGIVVERPIYFTYAGAMGSVTGGHNAMGVTAPRASWYFGEGYTGPGFDQYLTILNPNGWPAPVTITYYRGGGQPPVINNVNVAANSRFTVAVHEPGQGVGRNQEVSALVESAVAGGIVVERPIYFAYTGSMGRITGGHNAMGAAAPRASWYFADGATIAGFDCYLTLMNPQPVVAPVTLTYYVTGESQPRSVNLNLAARSRQTVPLHLVDQGVGRDKLFGIRVESNVAGGIVVERPTYFAYSPTINGGHDVMGAPATSLNWLFAEGYTGTGFDQYLVIFNPDPGVTAELRISYYLPTGGPLLRPLRLGPYQRASIAVHDDLQIGRGWPVSARVESENGVGVVAERPLYFRYGTGIDGGHTVVGYTP
jgi:hypothetical protein